MPRDGKPVDTWPKQNSAFADIVRKIHLIVDIMLHKQKHNCDAYERIYRGHLRSVVGSVVALNRHFLRWNSVELRLPQEIVNAIEEKVNEEEKKRRHKQYFEEYRGIRLCFIFLWPMFRKRLIRLRKELMLPASVTARIEAKYTVKDALMERKKQIFQYVQNNRAITLSSLTLLVLFVFVGGAPALKSILQKNSKQEEAVRVVKRFHEDKRKIFGANRDLTTAREISGGSTYRGIESQIARMASSGKYLVFEDARVFAEEESFFCSLNNDKIEIHLKINQPYLTYRAGEPLPGEPSPDEQYDGVFGLQYEDSVWKIFRKAVIKKDKDIEDFRNEFWKPEELIAVKRRCNR